MRSPFFIKYSFILICLLCSVFSDVRAADQDMFDVFDLEVEGKIFDFVTGDFDADQLVDIAIIYTPLNDPNARYIGLYLQKSALGFRPRADYLVPLPASVVQIDAGNIDSDPAEEILLIDGEGVLLMQYDRNTGLSSPTRYIRQETIYSIPFFHGIIVAPFAFDIVGDEVPELFIPGADGFYLYEQGDDQSYELMNRIKTSLNSYRGNRGMKNLSGRRSMKYTLELPRIEIIDGNADDRSDIYFLWDHKVDVFFQDNTGNFSQVADSQTDLFPVTKDGYMQSRLADCNGDGRPDVVASCTTGGITNTETRLRFYFADGEGRLSNTFSSEINLSDSHCNLVLCDYNQDGRPEIVLPSIEMGAIAASKMFLLKKADLHLLVYAVENGVPTSEPIERMKYQFRIDFECPNPTSEIKINWSVNYNSDNLLDAVFSDGNGRLLFFWGHETDYLSGKPDLELTLDHPSTVYPIHLNKGFFSDLIVEHNMTGRYDRLTVLKNRNNNL
jgi:hypothetical protein